MVEFKTSWDEKTLEKITEIQLEKNKKFLRGIAVFFMVMGLLLLLIAYDDYKSGESYYYSLFVAVFSIAFGILFPSFMKSAIKRNQESQNRSSSTLTADTEMLFKFDKDRMFIFVTKGEKFRSAIDTDYDYIFKVVEDEETFVLYVSKMECYVLNKTNLISGTLDEFYEILKTRLTPNKIEKVNSNK